jgi:hypothetical protein
MLGLIFQDFRYKLRVDLGFSEIPSQLWAFDHDIAITILIVPP